jgi:predicted nucleic acid-binding protein
MPATAAATVVITDANVLINFVHIGQLALLGELPAYRFQLPTDVLNELTDGDQRAQIEVAIADRQLELMVIEALDALTLFGDLRDLMGRGEAACLAVAATTGCHLASDEKKRFRRKAIELIGEARIVRTEDLLVEAIRCGRRTVAQADAYKLVLAANRYAMPFSSFADLV